MRVVVKLKIINVVKEKDKVKITLSDNTSFLISKENYLNNPLIIDNEITKEEVAKAINQEKIFKAKEAAYKFMNRKRRSEVEVSLLLSEVSIDEETIEELLITFRSQGYLNDLELARDIVNRSLINKHGKEKIREKLNERMISYKDIDAVISSIDEEEYEENLIKLIENYSSRYKNDSFALTNKKITNNLLSKGYSFKDIEKVKNILHFDEESEIESAKKQLIKLCKREEDLNSWPIRAKIKAKLINKGFKNDIIERAFRGVVENEID
jgi:regulatory protein